MMMEKVYKITPVPKPRQTISDKWKQRPSVMAYRAFADKCRAKGMFIPGFGAEIIFVIPMPNSWSKKKKQFMDGVPHKQRPDLDNLIKSVLDAVHKEDSHIWDLRATKIWGRTGQIIIR